MDITILKEIGLTEAQIKVYLTLLELGTTKTGPIIQKTGLSGSVVYRAIEELIKKGLVSCTIKAKTKHFAATEPKNLLRLWEDKKTRIEEALPELEAKQKPAEKQETKMYLGWKGIQTAYNSIFDVLPKGSEYITFATITRNEPENVAIFFKNFHRKRLAMNYRVKLIANKEDKNEFIKKYGLLPGIETRFVADFAPTGITIYGDNTLIVTFEENPMAIIITSKQIAEHFRNIFYKMWTLAK